MALTRRTESGSSSSDKDIVIENLDETEYESRLVAVADLGLQEGMVYMGEKKPDAQQIALGFEVLGETYTEDGVEKPRMLWSETINIFSTLTEKGKEIQYYSVFEPSATAGEIPDWDGQIGKPCNLSIVHVPDKKDSSKLYDNIGKVTPIPVKYQDNVPPATITDLGIGDADDPNNPVTKSLWGLPKYVYNKRIGAPAQEEKPNVAPEGDDVPY